MYCFGSGRSKESSSSGSRGSRSDTSTRGRSPRRSRSPSPRGRRSPSSSRSSRRSPSPRRTSRVCSPSGGSRTRRGSEQRDGSLSRTRSPKWHLHSSQRYPQFLGSYSPSRHSESSVEQSLWTEFSSDCYDIATQERRRLSDSLGLPIDSLSDVDRPEEASAVPKKLILKKQVDDPSMQNLEDFLSQKDSQELTSESADLHNDFLLPHERASQDGSGFLHILDRMVDSTNAQEKRTCNFLDVEDEEKFLYGDGQDNADFKYPTEKLMDSWKESLSLNARSPSPIHFIKPDTLDGSRIAFEKIRDLLKTIGLDIGVVEIGKGAARTEERLHGKKTLHSLDGNSVVSHKPKSIEKDCIQSNSHSPESNQKNSLSPCDYFQPSNDVSSLTISEQANSRTLRHSNSAGTSEQSFFPVSVIPSASPPLPNLPLPNPLISHYPVSHFSAYTAAQLLPNHPPPTVAPPIYNAYGQYMAYSASAWPMYTPPFHQSNPALPDVHGLVSVSMPPKPTRSNLRVIETVSTVKQNPEIKKYKSVLVEIPITPTNSKLLSQSNGGTPERVSDEKYLASEMPKVMDGREKPKAKKETQNNKLQYLKTELCRLSRQRVSAGQYKSVWICGHSIVSWASLYAAVSGWGIHLGLDEAIFIKWIGVEGMLWNSLVPTVLHHATKSGPPDALVIQLGENDLGTRSGLDLSRSIMDDLGSLLGRYPGMQLFWSDLLERRTWHGAVCPNKVDLARRKVARSVARFVEASGGFVIYHPDITFKLEALFQPDGVHLSSWGQDIWLHGIRYGLWGWLQL
ncbi:zinc finger protein 318-like isoform X2 [Eublepharis macularius]|uniref:Zinc finger protein 318-like isoform X2 n=1 Tax=Eublepharis macularius TaxID=481883 RepID=A0AA97LAF6_EUBMA|nr:zinc finger protein 318-like isoform X2 [Eublepharis macularius]